MSKLITTDFLEAALGVDVTRVLYACFKLHGVPRDEFEDHGPYRIVEQPESRAMSSDANPIVLQSRGSVAWTEDASFAVCVMLCNQCNEYKPDDEVGYCNACEKASCDSCWCCHNFATIHGWSQDPALQEIPPDE